VRCVVLSLVLALSSVGCAGELENPDDFMTATGADSTAGDGDGDFECDPPALFLERCTGPGCHSSQAPAALVDFETPGIAERLVDVEGTSFCNNALLIDSANPLASLLLDKLGPEPSCGSQMPIGSPLSAEEVACIEQFVMDAASASMSSSLR